MKFVRLLAVACAVVVAQRAAALDLGLRNQLDRINRQLAGRLLDFTTEVDDTYVNTHRGDGLIVATPTGSTAYALSCGGPIIQPNVDALVMVPICPHTLSDRPLVLPSSSTIRITLDNAGGSDAHVVCDGEPLARIAPADMLTISLAKQAVTLLHPRDYNYYELLRSKLNWGRASRDRAKPQR